ncbi:MAG: hypothetical protein NXI00_20660 [Cytophagales bacterium]|nr:hypothetical protein [Cytophagales bacterium]
MKLKIAAILFLGSLVFSACSRKQCPAYGSVSEEAEVEVVKV